MNDYNWNNFFFFKNFFSVHKINITVDHFSDIKYLAVMHISAYSSHLESIIFDFTLE